MRHVRNFRIFFRLFTLLESYREAYCNREIKKKMRRRAGIGA